MSRFDEIETIITNLGEAATTDQFELALRDYPDRDVRTVLAERAARGGGSAEFPDEWTVGAEGSLLIEMADRDETALDLRGVFTINADSLPLQVQVSNTQVALIDTDGKLRVTPATNTADVAQPALAVDAPATVTNLLRIKTGNTSVWTLDKDGVANFNLGSGANWMNAGAGGVQMAAPAGADIEICDADFNMVIQVTDDNKLGFYNHAAVAQQTGVAVSTAGIHAALVALGLITA